MILTRDKILAEVQFEPKLDEFQVNPHSIDLRIESDVLLMPGVLHLCRTMEKVTLPDDLMAVVYPRSSTNRRFIAIDMTGVVDAGYSGHLIMPMTNCNDKPITIKRGERVAQIVFHRIEDKVTPRKSKYHNTDGGFIPDKDEEWLFLNSGDIMGLKEKYGI